MTTMTTVVVRYFAAARAAAGRREESLELPAGGTVEHVLTAIRDRHGEQMAYVLRRCSFLLDEVAVGSHVRPVLQGSTLDVLPPFAGG